MRVAHNRLGAIVAHCPRLVAELCDGIADETFNAKGSNAANFVKPIVTKLAASLWMYSYEASRSSATAARSPNARPSAMLGASSTTSAPR